MKDPADNKTVDFVSDEYTQIESEMRREQEHFFMQIIWSLQGARLSTLQ
ncbi:hypothetical protein [Parashewanella tropica]|nr:hypothetical protein [Parashewanella tropica]